jgi:lysyl-tRNA synthetase class 2
MHSPSLSTWQKLRNDPLFLNRLKIREAMIDAIRAFFKQNNFTEVSTPQLVLSPGTEPFLEVFETTLKIDNFPDRRAFLLTSPEYALKKLIAGGLGSCFEICKSFRNGEGISTTHNHEFTILEWYHVNGDYTNVMTDLELMVKAIALKLMESTKLDLEVSIVGDTILLGYQGKQYDLSAPWERISVADAFQTYAQVSERDLHDEIKLVEIAHAQGLSESPILTWEEAFHLIMLNKIEPHLGRKRPTILYDYPTPLAALAKKKTTDPRYAERFEVYLAGLELGNAFSELLDADEQEERFRSELALRTKLGKTEYKLDGDYLAALRSGLPPTGGIAVGIDRLAMLFANTKNIQDVVTFPINELFAVND